MDKTTPRDTLLAEMREGKIPCNGILLLLAAALPVPGYCARPCAAAIGLC